MREEVNTEQGTASKKSEIPSFYEARKKKKESVSDFLCSCSAAVLARSRSHYLCIRKNLSAQRPSRFYIKNPKWKIHHISTDTKLDIEERTNERRTRKHPDFQPTLKHEPQVQQSHEKSMAERNVRQRRGVSVKSPCSMMTRKIPPMSLIIKAFFSRGTPTMLLEVIVSYTR